jgi:hypothetical protein
LLELDGVHATTPSHYVVDAWRSGPPGEKTFSRIFYAVHGEAVDLEKNNFRGFFFQVFYPILDTNRVYRILKLILTEFSLGVRSCFLTSGHSYLIL